MQPSSSPTPERLQQLAWGYAPPLIIEAAVKHRLFDHLNEGPRTTEELAMATGASARGVRALADALVGIQLLTRVGIRYSLTPESATFLVSTKPTYQGAFFEHVSTQLIPSWLTLPDAVRTGHPAERVNHGSRGPEFFVRFVESLFPLAYPAARKLGEHLNLSRANGPVSVLDLGAGSGVWGIALAQQSPSVRIRAVDWPEVLAVTQRVAQRHGLADRLTTAPGDLLEADFGSGHQVATIGQILHSEGVDRSRQLLRRTFDALAPGGTIAIMEFMVNEDRTGPPAALLFAVNMLVHTDKGDTFSFGQMSAWLKEAGFTHPRQLEVPAVSPLVLATKPC